MNAKKVLAFALSLILCLSLTVTAFAADEAPTVRTEGRLYAEGCTIGTTVKPGNNYTTLKAEEGGKLVYADDSQIVFTFENADPAKLNLSEARVELKDGDGYYVSDMLFSGGTLTADEENGSLTFTMDSEDLVFNNDQGYTIDNGGLEWSAQGGDGGGRYRFNLALTGVKYDGAELAETVFPLNIYIWGREFSARCSPMGASNSRWGAGNFNELVLPVAEEKPLESKPEVGSEPVWTWVGEDSAGKPILCDYLTDDFYISWPAGMDASAIGGKDVTVTLFSQYGDERVLVPNTTVKEDPEDVKFLPDGEYSVYSSEDTTQVSVNLVNWAYTPVYNKMTIEVNDESMTYDVGSVYQYSIQQGGGIDYDKTVTCATLFGVANLGDYSNEELFKEPFTYSWVFRVGEGMGAPTLLYVEHEDGSYETVREQSGGGPGGPGGGQQAPKPEGSEFPSDADVRFVGNTLYWTNFEGTKQVVVHTDDPDFAEFDGKEVTFVKNYNAGMGYLGKIDKSIEFEVADGYVKTIRSYGDHMNWAWAEFATGDAHGWINPDFVPAEPQGGPNGGQQGGPNGGQQGGPKG